MRFLLTAGVPRLTAYLTGKKCKIANVYAGPNGLTAQNPSKPLEGYSSRPQEALTNRRHDPTRQDTVRNP